MATILRVRWAASLTGTSHPILFQTFWRPGTSGGSTADASDCSARVRACLLVAANQLSSGITFRQNTEVDALEDTSGALTGTYTAASVANVTGVVAGDVYAPACAYLVDSRTSLIVGRRFLKGRTYLAGCSEAGVDTGGGVPSTVASALNSGFNGMLTGGSTASFPVVWHRPPRHTTSGGTSGPVISYSTVVGYLGSQRRRRF